MRRRLIVLAILLSIVISVSIPCSTLAATTSSPGSNNKNPSSGSQKPISSSSSNTTLPKPLITRPSQSDLIAYLKNTSSYFPITDISANTSSTNANATQTSIVNANGNSSNGVLAAGDQKAYSVWLVTYKHRSHIMLSMTPDGNHWTPTVEITQDPNHGNASAPQVGADASNMAIAWQETTKNGTSVIMLASSMDNGQHTKIYPLSDIKGGNAHDPKVVILNNRTVVTWEQDITCTAANGSVTSKAGMQTTGKNCISAIDPTHHHGHSGSW